MTLLPDYRRERDWSLSHRRLAQSRVGDVAALHKLAGSSVMYITVAICLRRLIRTLASELGQQPTYSFFSKRFCLELPSTLAWWMKLNELVLATLRAGIHSQT